MPRDAAARTVEMEKHLASPGLSDLMAAFEDQLEAIHTGNDMNIKLCVGCLRANVSAKRESEH